MTAASNKKLLQDIYAKVAEGDGALFVSHLADDVTLTVTGHNSWSRTFKGKESVLRDLYGYVRSRLQGTIRTIPVRFIAEDDWVVLEARGDMVSKSGVRYENQYCIIFGVRNGKIVEIREYLDSLLCEQVLGPYPATTVAAPG